MIEKKRAAENDLKELPNLKIGSKAFNNWVDELSLIMLPDIKDLFRHTNGFSREKAKEDFEIRLKDIASFVISVAQKNIAEHSWSWLTIIENETETMLIELESYAHLGRY